MWREKSLKALQCVLVVRSETGGSAVVWLIQQPPVLLVSRSYQSIYHSVLNYIPPSLSLCLCASFLTNKPQRNLCPATSEADLDSTSPLKLELSGGRWEIDASLGEGWWGARVNQMEGEEEEDIRVEMNRFISCYCLAVWDDWGLVISRLNSKQISDVCAVSL